METIPGNELQERIGRLQRRLLEVDDAEAVIVLQGAAHGPGRAAGDADRFMNTGPAQVRFVGHGVGLELDEIPVLAEQSERVLEPGMTLAIAPKSVFPGRGIVGIEDTVLLTCGPPECLTFTPRELAVL